VRLEFISVSVYALADTSLQNPCMGNNLNAGKARYATLIGRDPLQVSDKGGKVGLQNLGNTCFMNTGLQCLCHLEPFVAYFLTGKHREEINKDNPLGSGGAVVLAIARLQQAMWQKQQSSLNPKDLHGVFKEHAPHLFEEYEQQDVQEFLAFCLDALHEDLNLVTSKPSQSEDVADKDQALSKGKGDEFAAALAWFRYLQNGKSFLVDLFQGQLSDQLACVKCGYLRRRFEPFLYLTLPVTRKMRRIQNAIDKYLEEEVLTGDEQWLCPRCKEKRDATKKISLWKLPPVLILHLKRFAFDARKCQFDKIDTTLVCPGTFDLSSFVASPQREHALYDVVAVANHHGRFGSGHYTAYCRVGTAKTTDANMWYHFNDSRVNQLKVADNDIVTKDAYVIFLVRRAGDGQQIKRQSISLPEVWPHFASDRNSVVHGALAGTGDQTVSGMRRNLSPKQMPKQIASQKNPEDVEVRKGLLARAAVASPSKKHAPTGRVAATKTTADTLKKLNKLSPVSEEASLGVILPIPTENLVNATRPRSRKVETMMKNCLNDDDDDWTCSVVEGLKPPDPVKVDYLLVANLTDMGYTRQQAVEALKVGRNDINRAVSYLSTIQEGVHRF